MLVALDFVLIQPIRLHLVQASFNRCTGGKEI